MPIESLGGKGGKYSWLWAKNFPCIVVNSGAVITADSPNKYQWEIVIYHLCSFTVQKGMLKGHREGNFKEFFYMKARYTVKMVSNTDIPVPSQEVSYQTLPGRE